MLDVGQYLGGSTGGLKNSFYGQITTLNRENYNFFSIFHGYSKASEMLEI